MKDLKIKRIDMHIHVRMFLSELERETAMTRPARPDQTYATPEDVKKVYEQLGIEKGVLLPGVSPEGGDYSISNEETFRIATKYPDLFYWFCGIDPRWGTNRPDTDLSYFMNHWKALGAKGIGEMTCKLPFDDPKVQNLFYHAEKCDMPVLFHIGTDRCAYGFYDSVGLPQLERALKRFPKLRFIGHSAPFWAEISGDCQEETRNQYPKGPVTDGGRIGELMREYPNLSADLSANSGFNAITRDPLFSYGFLEEFQDRLFYATDICAPIQYGFFKLADFLDDAVRNEKISPEAYRKISRTNALKLLERK